MQNTNESFPRMRRYRGASRIAAALITAWWLGAPSALADSPASSQVSFDYCLVGIAKIDGISYASLIDRQNNYHYLLSTNQPEQGLVLTSVQSDDSPSGPSAVIQKDGVSVLVELEANAILAPSSLPSAPPTPNAKPAVTANGSGSADTIHLSPPPGGKLPFVFQAIDPQKMNLTKDQQAIIDQLRQNFLAAVNGAGQSAPGAPAPTTSSNGNANNPSGAGQNDALGNTMDSAGEKALANWQSAQEHSDEIFIMQFGTQAFNAYQMALSHQGWPKG